MSAFPIRRTVPILYVLLTASALSQPGRTMFKPGRSYQHKFTVGVNKSPFLAGGTPFESVPGPYGGTVRSFAADSGGWIYAATDGGVYRSTDNGSHWSTHFPPSSMFNSMETVTVLGGGVIAAETDYWHFISTDRGDTWSHITENVRGFAVDRNGDIYAGSDFAGVKKSTDTATSWSAFGLAGIDIQNVILAGSGRIICPTKSGMFCSSDKGTTWTFKPYAAQSGRCIVASPNGHLFSYGFQNSQLYRSTDFGDSWNSIPLPGDYPVEQAYHINAEPGGRLFVITQYRVLVTSDEGLTWSELGYSGDEPITVWEDRQANLWTGSCGGVHRMNGNTGKWEELNEGIHAFDFAAMQVTSRGTVITFSPLLSYRGSEAGNTWTQILFDSTVGVYGPALATSRGSVFAAAVVGDGEFGFVRSTDDGISWEKHSLLPGGDFITAFAEGPAHDLLFGTYSGQIFRSTTGGVSWSRVDSSSARFGIRSLAASRDGYYYASIDSAVLVSRDGIAWTASLLPRMDYYFAPLAADNQGGVYMGAVFNGVYHSTDHGTSWCFMNEGLTDLLVESIQSDDSNNVFLGTADGIYRLADSGNRWEQFASGFPPTHTGQISISPQGILYAGVQHYGIYRSTTPVPRRVTVTGVTPAHETTAFGLAQNYPNPFNPSTTITFELAGTLDVNLTVFDILGRVVSVLVNGRRNAGVNVVKFDGSALASGVYFYRLQAGGFVETKRLLLLH